MITRYYRDSVYRENQGELVRSQFLDTVLVLLVIELVLVIGMYFVRRNTPLSEEASRTMLLSVATVVGAATVVYSMVVGYLHGVEEIPMQIVLGMLVVAGINIACRFSRGWTGIYIDAMRGDSRD